MLQLGEISWTGVRCPKVVPLSHEVPGWMGSHLCWVRVRVIWIDTSWHPSNVTCHVSSVPQAVVLPLPSARQHPSYGDCLEVKREYYQNSSVLDCVTQCSQSVGQTDWVCHIIVTWSGSDGIQAWSQLPAGFLQCFDTVGLVIWPVKIVPEMTYYVSSGTLNPTHSLTLQLLCGCACGMSVSGCWDWPQWVNLDGYKAIVAHVYFA